MDGYWNQWTAPVCVPHELEKNKFIFVKRNNESDRPKPTTVLINPHFKENKKVFVNPKFQLARNDAISRPKVHVNPNILKPVTTETQGTLMIPHVLQNLGSGFTSSSTKPTSQMYNNESKEITKPKHPVNNSTSYEHPKSNSFCKINSNGRSNKIVCTTTKVINRPQETQINSKPNFHQTVQQFSQYPMASLQKLNESNDIHTENQRKVHTRLKIVNVPEKITNPVVKQKEHFQGNSICTRFKYIRKELMSQKALPSVRNDQFKVTRTVAVPMSINKTSKSPKSLSRNSGKWYFKENNSIRKNAVITRFKYIRNGAKLVKINTSPLKSKYKIVNNASSRSPQGKKTRVQLNSSIYRKKYVFLNKYNSSSFLANNVILKNSKQRNSMRINGILYQNPPCLLKKTSPSLKSGFEAMNQLSSRTKGKGSTTQVTQSKGKYRIVRSRLNSASKLRKSNVTCPIFRRTGKCNGQKNGQCIKVHNPDLIILCKSFLRGECHNDKCLLSHKVSSEKMPTCKYFLEGVCNKVGCQYLHVKISPNAEICRDFLEGFCKEGIKCDKRHQFLCPEYEKNKKCTKPKCAYPHGSSKLTKLKSAKKINKKNTPCKTKVPKQSVPKVEENCQIRYYKDNTEMEQKMEHPDSNRSNEEGDEKAIPTRKKLGSLPSFIPIS